jgi:hypothetical protein
MKGKNVQRKKQFMNTFAENDKLKVKFFKHFPISLRKKSKTHSQIIDALIEHLRLSLPCKRKNPHKHHFLSMLFRALWILMCKAFLIYHFDGTL